MWDPFGVVAFFENLSQLTGIQIDQITFITVQITALTIAPTFQSLLHPSKASPALRQIVSLVLGVIFASTCFGRQLLHLFFLSTVSYVLLKTVNPLRVQWITLIVTLSYLSLMHLYRLFFEYASYSLDITGPLMVAVQKLTSLAFILHDNIHIKKNVSDSNNHIKKNGSESNNHIKKNGSENNNLIKKNGSESNKVTCKITSVPSLLEFYGYMFNFQTLMVGPLVFFDDHMEWVNGENFTKHKLQANGSSTKNGSVPSPFQAVLKKVTASAAFGLLYVSLISKFPISKLRDDDFVEKWSLLSQILYLHISTTLVRFMYYNAWLLTDAVCNASGLGFNGYDEHGVSRWDLVTNVNIPKFEFGVNFKETIDGWNMGTNRWLRLIVYNRTKKFSTALTFALSALWHGFYPGYYLTFANGALFISAARAVRRKIRPYFQSSSSHKLFYDLATTVVSRVAMAYIVFPFVLLEFGLSMRIYFHQYFWMHILAISAVFLLPHFPSSGPEAQTFAARLTLTQSSNNLVTTSIHG
nr:PREDICTED: lysophospholipid acyltransferase 1 [Bemisia tabaci]